MARILMVLNYLMTACFLFSMVVQYNDPDPVRWMLIYGLAAAACVLSLTKRYYWPLFAAIGVAALVWAGLWAPNVIGKVAIGEMFEAFEMKDVRVEEARETGGLLIVAGWMAVLTFHSWRQSSRKA